MVRIGLEQVKRWAGNYEPRPIDIVTDGLAPHYAALSADASTTVREAAALFVHAEGQLDLGCSGPEVVAEAAEALKLFRGTGRADAVTDSLRLCVHAQRARAEALVWEGDLGGKVEQALRKARLLVSEELELSQELGNPRSEAAMLLCQAELGDEAEKHAVSAASKFEQAKEPKMQALAFLVLSRLRQNGGAALAAQQALQVAQGAKDSRGKALAELHLALAQIGSGKSTDIPKGSDAPGAKKLRGSLLCALSKQRLQENDSAAALPLAREAHGIFQELQYGKGWEAAALGSMVDALIDTGDAKQALQSAEQAVAKLKARDLKEGARAMHHLVHAMVANDQHQDAMKVAEEAVEISCQDLADHHSEVVLYLTIARSYLRAKRYRQAGESASRAETALQELGSSEDAESLTKFISSLQSAISDGESEHRQAASEFANRQVEDRKVTSQKEKEVAYPSYEPEVPYPSYEVPDVPDGDDASAHAHSFLASFREHMSKSKPDEALKAASIAVDLFYDMEDKAGEAQALMSVAASHIHVESFKLALWALNSSLEISRELDDRASQAEALHTLAAVHNYMQNPKDALLLAHEGLGIFHSDLQDRNGMMKMYFVIIDSYALIFGDVSAADRLSKPKHKGDAEKALSAGKKASKLAMEFDTFTEGLAQHYLCSAFMMVGKYKDALCAAEDAKVLFKKAGEENGQIQASIAMGEALVALRRTTRAKAVLQEAQKKAKQGSHEQELDRISSLLTDLSAEATLAVVAQVAAPVGGWMESAPSVGQAQVSAYSAPDQVEISRRIWDISRDMTGEEEMDADTPFMDAGIDSLASVELRTSLQKQFGVPLPSTVMFNYPTRSSIAEFIANEMEEAQISLT